MQKPMTISRFLQWIGATLVLLVLVGLNYNFDSEAGMRMNAPLDDSLSQGLRGYWKMDEGTGTSTTADASGNGNTLTMTGPPTWTTGTIGPYSMDFSGSGQYLSVASPASGVLDFAAGASFSITGWFNRDTFTADHTIVAKRNGQTATDDGYIVYIDDATDTLVFEASDTADTDEYQRISTSAFTATGWHQFAVTWNDSATTDPVNIFIDGALNNGTATGTFANIGDLTESVAFRIGAESDAGVPFDGKLDDIRVYGYPLSADEVAKLYQTTAPTQPVDTGLVGHWTFDGPDIQGTTAIDRSSFGNNGTITGALPTKGKLGQGLRFNGTSDYVSAPNSTAFTDLTVSVWVYPTITIGSEQYRPIISKSGALIANLIYYCTGFGCAYKTSVTSAPCDGTSTDFSTVNRWHHVVLTFNDASNRFDIYEDGNQVALDNNTCTSSFGANSNPIRIGYSTYSPGYFIGKIDDVRVYNRSLSASEVSNLYLIGR